MLLLVLTLTGIGTLSSIRGYVQGEGLWSKAQKRAVLALHRYARGGTQNAWQTFEDEIAVTLGGRMARQELDRPDPDMAIVREGFSLGGIPEEHQAGMAALYRRLRNVAFVSRAIGIWAEGDQEIDRVRELADDLREERRRSEPDAARIASILASIDEVDRRLTDLENAFTRTLNGGALQVERVLRWVLLGIAGTFVLSAAGAGRLLYRQVREREDVLERSEARYRTLFEESVVGTVVTGPEGTVVRANAAFADMLGYDDPDELLGLPAASLYADLADREPIVARVRQDGAVLMDELLARRKDGSQVWLMTSSVVVRDPEDGREGILATCLDVSERKELEERLARKGRMEAMGQLAGGIAHDFNNLLTAIQGNAQLLALDLKDREGVESLVESLDDILSSSRTAAELTAQLLAFSRGDPAPAKVVDLVDLVTRTRSLLERLLPPHVDLVTELDGAPIEIEATPSQLEQVLLNLVINARDAMPQGGRVVVGLDRVDVASGEPEGLMELAPGSYARLRVSDDGSGMPPEVRARLFEPFFTTKRGSGGTGMGLATVYGIVTRAEGAVRVESVPDEGSTFHVLLPLSTRPTPEVEEEPPEPSDRVEGRETVLLVEDDDAVRRVARKVLESEGYRVLEAREPGRALAFVEAEEPFDLLLTDVVMPLMNGRELAARILGDRPELPVLFMSGYSNLQSDDRDLGDANTASLAKPFQPTMLLEEVRRLLDLADRQVRR